MLPNSRNEILIRALFKEPFLKREKLALWLGWGSYGLFFVIFKRTFGKSIEHRSSEACMRITLRTIEKERTVDSSTNRPENERKMGLFSIAKTSVCTF